MMSEESPRQPEAAATDSEATPQESAADAQPEIVMPETVFTQQEGVVDPVQRLEQEKAELEDRLVRTQAELVNYRRRSQNELEQFRKYEGFRLVRDLLPTIDNLQRAISAPSNDVESLRTGVDMVARQLLETLARYQVEPIPCQGVAFDPNLHEAVHQMPSEEQPAMHVLEALETGYKMQDRIVRPAKVIVSTGPAAG